MRIQDLWQLTLWTCIAVFAAILIALLIGMARAHRSIQESPETPPGLAGREIASRRWVIGASVLSAVLLTVLLGADMLTDRSLSRLPVTNALRIEMIAQQWWWEARYLDAQGRPEFAVSSELHVPVGVPVIVSLKSIDVIHTFWVPSLHGKKDMLPDVARNS